MGSGTWAPRSWPTTSETPELLGVSAHVQQPARALPRTKRAKRFTLDGKAVLYTSDLTGYSNMYLVEVGEFDELPDLE